MRSIYQGYEARIFVMMAAPTVSIRTLQVAAASPTPTLSLTAAGVGEGGLKPGFRKCRRRPLHKEASTECWERHKPSCWASTTK